MGLFDENTRKLAGDGFGRHVKADRLTGPFDVYEGYDDAGLSKMGRFSRVARRRLQAALDQEALAMGVIGLAVGLALGAVLMSRRRR